jgi:hypothetical protein
VSTSGAVFSLIASVLLLSLPRRLAALPLLLGAAYVTREAVLGPANLTVLRILVAVGVLRAILRGERSAGPMNTVDRLVIIWGIALIASSAFHTSDAWIYRLGIVWTDWGCYFLLRIFLRHWEDVTRVFKMTCVVLVPVALLMLVEKVSGHNPFSVLGGYEDVIVRDGHIRARGPFAHPILAGTVGATCLPMAIYLWKSQRGYAWAGLFASLAIILSSTSSGPIMMAVFALLGLAMWKARTRLRGILRLAILGVIAIQFVMNDPVYFLMARIDIAGGSTGWYRARLIQSSFEHIGEWWLAGTDYTRHWMASGVYANTNHADITNHVLAMGVLGGLPLMLLFLAILAAAFLAVSRAIHDRKATPERRVLAWTLGAVLFSHCVNFLSISLYDQSVFFFYLVLAAIGALSSERRVLRAATGTPMPNVHLGRRRFH